MSVLGGATAELDGDREKLMEKVLERRVSNALIKDAAPDFEALFIVADMVGFGGIKSPIKLTMSLAKKLMGGLWVGGTTCLTEDALVFRPNWPNRLIHAGDCSVNIPLTDLVGIMKVPGVFTQIIDAKTAKGTLRFRCYRRDSFYDLIVAQRVRRTVQLKQISEHAGKNILTALYGLTDAFNAHDLDRIMSFFAEDAVLEMPRGRESWGTRFVGKSAVREGLSERFKGIPNVHYGDATHCASGDTGVSRWTVSGTTSTGQKIRANGCDFYTFRDGLVVKKDSYWKIVEV